MSCFPRLLQSVIGSLVAPNDLAPRQQSVAFLRQRHNLGGVVVDIWDGYDLYQPLPHQIFDIVFHTIPVAVVSEFGQFVLGYNTELPDLGERVNLGIPQRIRLIAVCVVGSYPLLKNFPHTFFTWHRRAFPARTLWCLTSESVATLFFSVDVLQFSPLVPGRTGTATHATLRAGIRAAEIINVETVEAL